jgi:hypothetical protein
MAKLLDGSYPGVSFDTDTRTLAHPVIKFPAADSFAYYAVISMKPLVLQHVPAGDGWSISAAHIRGLRAEDVSAMIAREKALAALFAKRVNA